MSRIQVNGVSYGCRTELPQELGKSIKCFTLRPKVERSRQGLGGYVILTGEPVPVGDSPVEYADSPFLF